MSTVIPETEDADRTNVKYERLTSTYRLYRLQHGGSSSTAMFGGMRAGSSYLRLQFGGEVNKTGLRLLTTRQIMWSDLKQISGRCTM